MKLGILNADIVSVTADALIYSTNVQLMLSGGVGACLLEKFGNQFQNELYRQIDSSGRKLAEVGEVFITEPKDTPWQVVYHTIATDPLYYTDPKVVRSIIQSCLEDCRNRKLTTIVMSPLGAGYGDLELGEFIQIVSDEAAKAEATGVENLTICCDQPGHPCRALQFGRRVNHGLDKSGEQGVVGNGDLRF